MATRNIKALEMTVNKMALISLSFQQARASPTYTEHFHLLQLDNLHPQEKSLNHNPKNTNFEKHPV